MCHNMRGTAVVIRTLRLCCLNMQNTQTTVKQQENSVSTEANILRWKQQKLEHCQYYMKIFVYMDWHVQIMKRNKLPL